MNLVAKDLINTICLLTSYNKNDALILTQPNNLHFYFSNIGQFWKVVLAKFWKVVLGKLNHNFYCFDSEVKEPSG